MRVGMRVGMRGAEPGVGQPAGLAKAQREQGAGRAEVQNPGIELVDVVAPAVFGEKRVEPSDVSSFQRVDQIAVWHPSHTST